MIKKKMGRQTTTRGKTEATEGLYPLGQLRIAVAEAIQFDQIRIPKGRRHGPLVCHLSSHKGKLHNPGYRSPILEGRAESDAVFLFEANREVEWYKPQPFTLYFHSSAKTEYYTTDFLLYLRNQPSALCEIKPAAQLEDPKVRRRLAIVQGQCEAQGFQFWTLTAEEVQKKPRIDVLQYLYPYARQKSTPVLAELLEFLRSTKRATPLTTIQKHCPNVGPREIAIGIFRGQLKSSYRMPWGPLFNVELAK